MYYIITCIFYVAQAATNLVISFDEFKECRMLIVASLQQYKEKT